MTLLGKMFTLRKEHTRMLSALLFIMVTPGNPPRKNGGLWHRVDPYEIPVFVGQKRSGVIHFIIRPYIYAAQTWVPVLSIYVCYGKLTVGCTSGLPLQSVARYDCVARVRRHRPVNSSGRRG